MAEKKKKSAKTDNEVQQIQSNLDVDIVGVATLDDIKKEQAIKL